jgi:hypothetical protein
MAFSANWPSNITLRLRLKKEYYNTGKMARIFTGTVDGVFLGEAF